MAYVLKQRGFEVVLFEEQTRLFEGASGKNQFRLHAGFHYPRSHITREQIQRGLKEFNDRLPHFTRKLDTCIYAVSATGSLMDFGTFTSIFDAECIPYQRVFPQTYGLSNVEGAIHTPTEEVFYVHAPRDFYEVCVHIFLVSSLFVHIFSIETFTRNRSI